uniref:Putative sterigmatocystin biosynthesis P450 monooxygenase n=1 Tax=Talaromyces marneffei PM1 TaxID=1077442 RepID=A0A093V4B3_TALMA
MMEGAKSVLDDKTSTELVVTTLAGFFIVIERDDERSGIFPTYTYRGTKYSYCQSSYPYQTETFALNAFSEKALREQEGIIQKYVKKLMEQLSPQSNKGPQDMVKWFNFTTYDLIRDLSFGEQFGCLENGKHDPFVQSIKDISKELTMIQMFKYYGLLGLRGLFMPKAIAGARAQNMQRAIETVDRRVNSKTNRKDFLHYVLAAMETEKGMSRAEMNVNTFSLSIAGSESSATLLCGFVFHTLAHPNIHEELVKEVMEAFKSEQEIVMANVHGLTYLNAVLQECLRIYPPVAVTLPRVVPDGGE